MCENYFEEKDNKRGELQFHLKTGGLFHVLFDLDIYEKSKINQENPAQVDYSDIIAKYI